MILVRGKNTYFFKDCALYVDGRYVGSGAGSGEFSGGVLMCCSGDRCLRLVEDGYVYVSGDVVEVGLLRDYGGYDEVRSFEDGALYIYRLSSVNGNGVFRVTAYGGPSRSVHGFVMATAGCMLAESLERGRL